LPEQFDYALRKKGVEKMIVLVRFPPPSDQSSKRRARFECSQTLVSLNSRLEVVKGEKKTARYHTPGPVATPSNETLNLIS